MEWNVMNIEKDIGNKEKESLSECDNINKSFKKRKRTSESKDTDNIISKDDIEIAENIGENKKAKFNRYFMFNNSAHVELESNAKEESINEDNSINKASKKKKKKISESKVSNNIISEDNNIEIAKNIEKDKKEYKKSVITDKSAFESNIVEKRPTNENNSIEKTLKKKKKKKSKNKDMNNITSQDDNESIKSICMEKKKDKKEKNKYFTPDQFVHVKFGSDNTEEESTNENNIIENTLKKNKKSKNKDANNVISQDNNESINNICVEKKKDKKEKNKYFTSDQFVRVEFGSDNTEKESTNENNTIEKTFKKKKKSKNKDADNVISQNNNKSIKSICVEKEKNEKENNKYFTPNEIVCVELGSDTTEKESTNENNSSIEKIYKKKKKKESKNENANNILISKNKKIKSTKNIYVDTKEDNNKHDKFHVNRANISGSSFDLEAENIGNDNCSDVTLLAQQMLSFDKLAIYDAMKLCDLHVKLRHTVPPQHKIETRAGTHMPQPELIQQFEKIILLKRGSYSNEEDKIIVNNWKAFCEIHDWDIKNPKPFLRFRHGKTTYITRAKERRQFVQFLADGLPNRTLYSVYHRFRNLYEGNVSRRYTREEDEMIINHLEKNPFLDERHKYSDLATVLQRTRNSIWRRYKILKKKSSILK